MAGLSVSIELPIPPRELSPNGRADRHAKATEVARYREGARIAALEALAEGVRDPRVPYHVPWPGPLSRARLAITYGTQNTRNRGIWVPRDRDNALGALKAGIDGLVDAKVLVDDSAKVLELGDVLFDDGWGPGVRLTVTSLEDGDMAIVTAPAAPAGEDVDGFGRSAAERQTWQDEDGAERPFEEEEDEEEGEEDEEATPKDGPGQCMGCGCTDDRACEDGCWWVAPGLCSECAVECPCDDGCEACGGSGWVARKRERSAPPVEPMRHEFAPSVAGDACAVCGWERADHAASLDETGQEGPSAYLDDGAAAKAANNIGSRSTALASDQNGPKGGPKQGDLPIGAQAELHHDRPVSDHQVRFAGKAGLWLANTLHRDFWADLRIGHTGVVKVAFEVAGDGHAPVKDKDGDVVGLAEFRRLKVLALSMDKPRDETEGLPLFESERLQLRRELRLFAERIEHLAREVDPNMPLSSAQCIADIDASLGALVALVREGHPPPGVAEAAAQVAFDAWRLAEWYAAGGPGIDVPPPPFDLPPEDAPCVCGDPAGGHVGAAMQECAAEHEITMGDGVVVIQRCSCTGFRRPAAERDALEDVTAAAETPAAAEPSTELGSLLDESIRLARGDEPCGAMHSGHMGPCVWPRSQCTFPATEGIGGIES